MLLELISQLMKRTFRDWIKVLVLLLDEAAVVAIVIVVLRFLRIQIPLPVVIVIALIAGALIFVIHFAVIPSFHKKQVTGQEGMIGQQGSVVEPLSPWGTVMVNGERWKAKPVDNGKIEVDEEIEIVRIEGLTLKVRRLKA